ncbi:MAG: hypothetical protein R3F43_13085 [bacterium]
MDEIAAAVAEGVPLEPGWVCLTFDDGYASNHDLLPSLLGTRPWACYVSTAHIDDRHRVMGYRVRRTVLHAQGVLRVPSLGLTAPLAERRGPRQAGGVAGRPDQAPAPAGPGAAVAEIEAHLPVDQRQGWTPGSPARAS